MLATDGKVADDAPPEIAISTGIIIALVASFVQSLGLTIQRKSHLLNEALPQSQKKRDWQRPLWLAGFAIFITSNVLGSVFQIGALPIVVLAPLGAVSLLWNAFFARFLLGDLFSKYLIVGTVLIAGGAVLIAIFGVVKETTHSLEELLALYSRPSFIVWITLQTAVIVLILALAHYSENSLERGLQDLYIALPTSDDNVESGTTRNSSDVPFRTRRARRWSTPPAYLSINTEAANDAAIANPPVASPSATTATPLSAVETQVPISTKTKKLSSRHVSFGVTDYGSTSPNSIINSKGESKSRRGEAESSIRPRLPHDKAEKIRLWLGIAYGSASGTLSGLCLLFAKTGVELLILTVVGHNQFTRWESWMIVLVLLVCALLQLWYLNKSLRLVGPTLICPLAFCFYNLSSIFNGLMYYNQWSMLTGLQDGLMCLGIVILLAGVWIVSIKSTDDDAEEMLLVPAQDTDGDRLFDEESMQDFDEDRPHEEETFRDLKSRIAHLYQAFLLDQDGPPRGFSVGISASSPGFAIRPQHHQRSNTAHSLSSVQYSRLRHSHSRSDDNMLVSSPTQADEEADAHRPVFMGRTASEPATGQASATSSTAQSTASRERDALNYRHRRKRSLAGDIYVGSSDPFSEEPAIEPPASPTSPRLRRSSSAGASSSRRDQESTGTPTKGPLGRFLPWTLGDESRD